MPNTRPLVSAAFVCEKVLTEKDGVFSAVRIVDALRVPVDSGRTASKVASVVQISILVLLRSGDVTGPSELALVLRTPTRGEIPLPARWPVIFQGGEQGVDVNLTFALPVVELGLFWFDVQWNKEVLTSIPLRLTREETVQ